MTYKFAAYFYLIMKHTSIKTPAVTPSYLTFRL